MTEKLLRLSTWPCAGGATGLLTTAPLIRRFTPCLNSADSRRPTSSRHYETTSKVFAVTPRCEVSLPCKPMSRSPPSPLTTQTKTQDPDYLQGPLAPIQEQVRQKVRRRAKRVTDRAATNQSRRKRRAWLPKNMTTSCRR